MTKEQLHIGPCSPRQALVFERAKQCDFMIVGGKLLLPQGEILGKQPI